MHDHKCGYDGFKFDSTRGCGHVFSHNPTFKESVYVNQVHMCPNCGRGPWTMKWKGPMCDTGATAKSIYEGSNSSSVKSTDVGDGMGSASSFSLRAAPTGCSLTQRLRG